MSAALLIEQSLNGVQFGVMLFLMASGLTLIFGVMGLINLAHGSLYMVGAFAAAAVAAATGSFLLALAASLVAAAAAGANGCLGLFSSRSIFIIRVIASLLSLSDWRWLWGCSG